MQISEVRTALADLVRTADPAAKIIQDDEKEPVVRPAFRIDVLPMGGGAACGGARERTVDVDIWYYPKNTDHPQDECDAAADRLLAALDEGFMAGGIWIPLDEDVSCDSTQGVLVCQFGASWIETAPETGEPMEELIYNGEELMK